MIHMFSVDDLYVKNELNNRRFSEIVSHVIGLDRAQYLRVPLTIFGGTLRFNQDSTVAILNNIVLQEYLPKVIMNNKILNFQ